MATTTPQKPTQNKNRGMNAVSCSPYSVVNNAVPMPHRIRWARATRHGARKVLR